MKISIDNLLRNLSYQYYIPIGTQEASKIDNSVANIKTNLNAFFGKQLHSIKEFGSYKRDTILPAKYDQYSDVDLMLIFNREYYTNPPATYLNRLKEFASKYYSRSDFRKTSPSYTIELEHISYDLVPAYLELGTTLPFFTQPPTLKIPKGPNDWQTTDPDGFNAQLIRVNGQHSHQVKPLIRLLKAWNAKAGYPFTGYSLEKQIIEYVMYFGYYSSLETLFFRVIDNITSYTVFSFGANPKLESLKQNAKKVEEAVNDGQLLRAEMWLKHILPF